MLIVENNDLNKLSSALKLDISTANEEIEVLMDEIMRLQDVVSDLEDKISTLSKNEIFVSSQQGVFNSKL